MASETKETEAQEKIGVYICHCGGNISDHVDVHQLEENVKNLPGVTVTHNNSFMCSDPGQELIQNDIKDGKINRVVVASCAPALHEETFRNAIKRAEMNQYLYEHANIREQVSWVHDGAPATNKATCLVAAAIAKARQLEALEPIRVEAKNHTVVIGGGIAGMRAACDLSRRGIQVALVEKSAFLGGQTAQLDELLPTGEKAPELITQLAKEVLDDEQITVYTCAEIVASSGYVGNFQLILKQQSPETESDRERLAYYTKAKKPNGPRNACVPFAGVLPLDVLDVPSKNSEITLDTGAIVLATGFKTFEPHQGQYGYGDNREVITLPHLIELLAQNHSSGGQMVLQGRQIRRVAMIHCVGSRQIDGFDEPNADGKLNEYCSRVCCGATLQAASLIRERFPETHVFEFYRDIRTYGRGHEEYYERASNNNVLFFRFDGEEAPVVTHNNGGQYPLSIKVNDMLTFNEEIEVQIDLVVLAVGMEPSKVSDLVEMMKLPVGADHFLQEVHPKLRPVELANTGILLAGTCQAPMDTGEACAAAQAASVKVSNLLTRGHIELDPFVADVDEERCTGQGACMKACPIDDAVVLVAKKAQVNPALCTGCGICVAACDANAIDIKGWKLEQYESMVDAILAA